MKRFKSFVVQKLFRKIRTTFSRPLAVGLISVLSLSVVATAGSLTPPGSPGSTMHTLQELYDSVVGTFSSSSITANVNGSLMENLKYIEANLSHVTSNSLDFDEFVNAMTLDANTTVTNNAFSLTFQRASVSSAFEISGTASISNTLYLPNNGNVGIGGETNPTANLEIRGTASISNGFFVDSVGNVGMGTTSPQVNIDIERSDLTGDVGMYAIDSNTGVNAQSVFIAGRSLSVNTGGYAYMSFQGSGFSSTGSGVANSGHFFSGGKGGMVIEDWWASTSMQFWTGGSGGGGGSMKAVLNASSGNFGIGTTTKAPVQKLQVAGNILASTSGNVDLILQSSTNLDDKFTLRSVGTASNARLAFLSSASAELFTIASTGNVGVNNATPAAKFDVSGLAKFTNASISSQFEIISNSMTTGSIASISGTALAGGSIFNITVPVSSSANNAHGILLVKNTNNVTVASWSMGGALAIAGKIFSDGANSSCTGVNTGGSGCIDYAESYPTSDATLQAGDLAAVDPSQPANVKKADGTSMVLGIVSTNPAALITGTGLLSGSSTHKDAPDHTVPLAMSGRVPVRISEENGSIAPGDHLTVSATKPGYAMKATQSGMTIGIALEASNGQATIMTFVNTGYWAPSADQALAGLPTTGNPDGWNWPDIMTHIKFWLSSLYDITIDGGLIKTVRGIFHDIQLQDGATIYDRVTGQPYCVGIENGQMVTKPGLCGTEQASSTPEPTPTPTPTISPEPSISVTPTPIETPTPEVSPSDSPMPSPTPSDTPAAE